MVTSTPLPGTDDTAASFAALIASSHGRDLALARRFVGDEQDAADVVQESYLRAWRALPSFRREAHLSTWLHAIITNTARTWRRRRGPNTPLDEHADVADTNPGADPAWHADVAVDRVRLAAALADLPTGLRRVVILKDVRGLSHLEIAGALGISETAAKVRLHRARRRLREALLPRDGAMELAGAA
ncbi:MAG: polymerase subunit sigma-70 [Acidimicrobiales bacterium]|jgi:RNA polymerase sigma-70 factor (ECF subfamily)|nr:polymerase subunit sigma-70 [Acidimicrobiales bacterium]